MLAFLGFNIHLQFVDFGLSTFQYSLLSSFQKLGRWGKNTAGIVITFSSAKVKACCQNVLIAQKFILIFIRFASTLRAPIKKHALLYTIYFQDLFSFTSSIYPKIQQTLNIRTDPT